MNDTRLHSALRKICDDLVDGKTNCALVGGLAVSARTEPRFTRDVDLAVAVSSDRDAEALVQFLRSRQYRIEALVEHEVAARLATVRLLPPGDPSLFVDLLFASSGIEPEIVAAADRLDVIEGLSVRIATIPHLIATKVLSRDDNRRPQDRVDLVALIRVAGPH
jgi:predicted nucleotidyltransferase